MLQLYSPVHTVGISHLRDNTMTTGLVANASIYKLFQTFYHFTDLGNDQ